MFSERDETKQNVESKQRATSNHSGNGNSNNNNNNNNAAKPTEKRRKKTTERKKIYEQRQQKHSEITDIYLQSIFLLIMGLAHTTFSVCMISNDIIADDDFSCSFFRQKFIQLWLSLSSTHTKISWKHQTYNATLMIMIKRQFRRWRWAMMFLERRSLQQ